ncbi:hypothetical protein FRC08_006965 [Ceratobasidium sp. 394]|nr:hypothetical protein FRC08_006965 [Ceratobasidium sp. 394]KAG9089523.1 hypothetical protein FS749_001267 [Ceratobasidium sp. UAMH 11750]
MSRKPKARYSPYLGATTTFKSTLSSHISVIRHDTSVNQPMFIIPKAKRISRSKLRALELQEIEKRRQQDRMTTREHADLIALQHEVSGSNDPPPSLDDNLTAPADDAWEDVEDDEDSSPEDKPISLDELGLPTGRSEWTDRLDKEHKSWAEQLSVLCDAYLAYRSGESLTVPDHQDHVVTVLCVDIAAGSSKSFPRGANDQWANLTLVRHGYLSSSPHRPRVAFSISLLELVAAVMRRGPATSIQVMAKAFCDLRNVPYEEYFRDQLTDALDVYLMVEREVQHRVAVALGRDDPHWRLRNACMACTYKLESEPPLQYSMLVTMDGNDSLKHVAEAATSDRRTYQSSYYLTRDEVNACANEVQRRKKNEPQEETECEKRWKSAKPDNDPRKRAKLRFEETGVFVSTCRHSHILTVCDMVRSGELAKYGLATVDRLISTHGDDILDGYDCGCSFEKTALRAPTIGPRARAARLKFCTGGLHGPAHNRPCQLEFHCRLLPGAGLTDFENCETLFSSTNRLASTTRLASKYHRHQRIHRHLDGWDDDQHANLGRLLRSKYASAIAVIERAEASITQLAPDVSADKLEKFLGYEGRYLATLKVEDPDDAMAVEYINLRERLEAVETEYDDRRKLFISYDHPGGNLRKAAAANRVEARARSTMKQLLTLQQAVADFEEKHNISTPWTRNMKEWKDAEAIRRNRDLQRCIDDLERLSVQRIFELSRAGLRGLGYKLRMHIMQAVNSRSAALKSALERYNTAAAKVKLQPMSWETLTSISVLADFDLLRGSRTGVLEQEWALPGNRRAAEEYQRVQRAKEEIMRLNVEVRRVHTAITDERQILPELAKQVPSSSPQLRWAVDRYVERRLSVNKRIMGELSTLMRLREYTGLRDTGVRIGSRIEQATRTSSSPPSETPHVTTIEEPAEIVDDGDKAHDVPEAGVDDETCDMFDRVYGAFESMSV